MGRNHEMKPSARKASAAIALGLFAVAGAANAETIQIGIAGPMTGPVTQYGDMVKEGALTAIEMINAAGGVNGDQLEAVFFDDACEPKQAVAVANNIVSSDVRFVVGHVCSGSTIPAADIYDNEGIVMITPSATAPALTDDKPRSTIFRTIGRDDQQGPVAARYIVEHIKPQTVAVLHDKQSYGQGIATVVKRDLEAANIPVAVFEGINAGDSDYSAVITKLKSAGVDFVYYGGYHPEMGLLLRQARELGLEAGFMGPEGVANSELVAIAGPASEGMLMTLPADFSQNPANAEIVKAFQEKNRDAAGAFQLPAYAAVQIIAEGIAGAGTTDPVAVAEYIHANTFETPLGPVSYNEKGDLESFEFVVFRQNSDGSRVPAN